MRSRSLLMAVVAAVTTATAGLTPAATATADIPDAATPFIVGGGNATEIYSFMASLQNSAGTHLCGGALIKPDWVVTTAQCPTPYLVRISNVLQFPPTVVVAGRITHPSADLALLRLRKPVAQAPVTLASTSAPVGTPTRILGWGQTCPSPGCGAFPINLQQLDTSIIDDSECSGGGINAATEICTDNPNGNLGPCLRDSGGPQLRRINNTWQLVGIISRPSGGPTCGSAPSIHVDLPVFRPWLTQVVGPL